MGALEQIGFQMQGGNHTIADPGTGNIFQQFNIAYGTASVGAGTYTLPDNGLPMYVRATGAVTIQSEAAVTVATLASGEVQLFVPLSATTWATPGTESTISGTTLGTGFIDLPLVNWRKVTSNDITNAAGNGGVGATDSTPALEYVNGDTQSTLQWLWAAAGVDPIVTQVMLPPDLDDTQPIVFHATGIVGGVADTPLLSLDSYFYGATGDGGTKVEDNTGSFGDGTSEVTATIAGSDVIAGTLTIEVTPAAHGTDTLAVFSTWLTYTRAF
jgi:hypothetical protein